MSNEFTTLKNERATQKIILARLNPARDVSYLLTNVSGYLYEMTFHMDNLNKVEINGIEGTEVEGTPASFGEYSFDKDTRLLQIMLGAAIEFYQEVGAIVVEYYLFLTNEEYRVTYLDPEDDETEEVHWIPRINTSPTFNVTQEDIIDGFFTIGNSELVLDNEDDFFQQFFGQYDSFCLREIKIWQCLNSTENISKLFFGTAANMEFSGNKLTISVDNLFSNLANTYISNETLERSTYRNPNFNVEASLRDNPILKLFCLVSKSVLKQPYERYFQLNVSFGMTGSGNINSCGMDDGFKAVNIDYNPTVSKTNNRIWACCIESETSSDHTEIAGPVTEESGIAYYKVQVADAKFYRPNCQIKMTGELTGYEHNHVAKVDYENNFVYFIYPIQEGVTIFRPSISLVTMDCGLCTDETFGFQNLRGGCPLIYDRHYTIDVVDGVRCIVLADNFEDDIFYLSEFPDVADGIRPDNLIFFRAWNHDDVNHAQVVKELVENAGLEVDQDLIDTAALVETNTHFTVPLWGETTVLSVKDYLEKVLNCMLGHLSLTNDLKVGYHLIGDLNPTEEIDEDILLRNSLSQYVDYKDIYSSLVFYNPHGDSIYNDPYEVIRFVTTTDEAVRSDKARFLHKIQREKNITSVLESMSHSKQRMMDILSNRRLTISFKTKGINFDSILGDEFIISSSKIIDGQKNVKLLTVNKSAADTQLRASDLLGA